MKVTTVPAVAERDAYVQVSTWTRPDGGPWVPIKDKATGATFAWRHYFPAAQAAEEKVGITPPPAPSVSLDGGITWTPLKGVSESEWVTALKADEHYKWHIRREGARLLARKSK
jgi:hypothetical protein